ncbi:MAG: cytochrome P450 [Gammaproteobacteria bacterium]|nr:cytochrome P450 [Gammaproteobacteria bacterium]MYD77068.1 cytochrome P450 [Gammaproteobacteria bacterium]MYJ52235.1 cytochrome P450 [Gammaproteobacteria bacterium]
MTIWHPSDDGHADLSDHDTFTRGVPHNTFARLRREDPMAWCEGGQFRGYWSMTRHEDIMQHNRNTELLSSARGIRMEDQTYEEYVARRTFQETDPPEHTRTRIRVGKAFSKPVIDRQSEVVRGLCCRILDTALEQEEFDAAALISRQLPMRMLGQILGIPKQDLDWLVTKGDELIANTDPEYTDHILDRDDTQAYRFMPFRSPAGADLFRYAKRLMEERRTRGEGGGVLDLILEPDDGDNVISDVEFRNFFCLLVAAGNDTTRYTISAAIHALACRPELLEQLKRGDDAIWRTAPDEFIRWASPTMHFRRTATRDFELHGKRIREGDKVVYWFVSANRDETRFDRPFDIDLSRSPNPHLAFGQGGPHICLGMWLARMETRILLQELVRRTARLELAGDIEYLRSNFVGGIKRLPVRVIPETPST